ncbi:MAG: hypothetical protein L0213_15200 [Candidatus Dadabacteria bacterium]|nr:hypothetical protein [Candidatus Dadabacteria bacterium]
MSPKAYLKKAALASLAIAFAVLALTLILLLPWYPCGYFDRNDTSIYAGYGYHSLYEIAGKDFGWTSDTVPNPYERYTGTGPYSVSAELWIILLYIPIFLTALYYAKLLPGLLEKQMSKISERGKKRRHG